MQTLIITPTQQPTPVAKRGAAKARSSFLSAVILFLFFVAMTFAIPPHCGKLGYFAELKDKHHILENAASPKIIFLGGSNLAFGLDSSAIERKFHRPVINMGLCSSFGLRYTLEEIKDNISAGDMIIIVPEYALLESINGNPDLLRTIEVYPQSALFILRAYTTSPRNIFILLQLVFQYIAAKWNAFHEIFLFACRHRQLSLIFVELPEISSSIGKPARLCFDKHGDYFGHFGQHNIRYTPLKWSISNMPREVANLIDTFGATMRKQGAQVLVIPAPIPKEYFNLSDLRTNNFSTWSNKLRSVPVLSSPIRYILPASYFYEAPYHLNIEGRALRTKLIIEDLARYLPLSDRQSGTAK